MAHIPRQDFSKSVQLSLAHIPRQILARFSRRPYNSLLAHFPRGRTTVWHRFRDSRRLVWLARISRQAVQQVAILLHENRGRFHTARFCCPFGTKIEICTTSFIAVLHRNRGGRTSAFIADFLGTKIEEAIQHLFLFCFCCLHIF